MADFSLADAISDDAPSQAPRTANVNPSAPMNGAPPATNPGWPGAAPGGPSFPPSGGPAQPSAPGGFPQSGPGAPGSFPPGPGAPPGQYPSAPSAPGYPPGPGMPGLPPQGPGQFPPGGAPMPYGGGQFPSIPGAPQGPYPNVPYPAGPPAPGMYGPGGPAAFPPAGGPAAFPPAGGVGPGFAGGAFPPVPPGSWGVPGGGFPPHPGPPAGYGPGPMGPYGGPGAPGGMLPVPYDLPLHAGIMPNLLITIVGEPVPGADRFQVDFVKGSDVVFHFNPRFPEQTIVRNSNLGGYWGPEEREGGFPFVPGRQFELKILVDEDVFKIAVDGVHLLEYEHRVGGLEEVTLVRVVGDITLYSIAPSMI